MVPELAHGSGNSTRSSARLTHSARCIGTHSQLQPSERSPPPLHPPQLAQAIWFSGAPPSLLLPHPTTEQNLALPILTLPQGQLSGPRHRAKARPLSLFLFNPLPFTSHFHSHHLLLSHNTPRAMKTLRLRKMKPNPNTTQPVMDRVRFSTLILLPESQTFSSIPKRKTMFM